MASPFPVTECYPIELHYIKALFLEGQYRRCIQACRDLIRLAGGSSLDGELLQKTFINFYLGLAHDEMARKMHHGSVAKLPSLNSAEQAFNQALDSLPGREQARRWCQQSPSRLSRQSLQDKNHGGCLLSHSSSPTEQLPWESSNTGSSQPFSPTKSHMKSLASGAMPWTQATDPDEDLESEDSFSELMTPNRLPRHFSRMSLLGDTAQLPREASSMSLLDSSPQKRFRAGMLRQPQLRSSRAEQRSERNTRLSSYNVASITPSKLPQLARRAENEPRPRPFRIGHVFEPEPVSPISSSGYARRWSNASTISAILPETPAQLDSGFCTSPSFNENMAEGRVLCLLDLIDTFKEKLKGHVVSIRNLREQTRTKTTRFAITTSTPLGRIRAAPDRFGSPAQGSVKTPRPTSGHIQQARSYWSFVPENVKEAEKKKRIESGRERNWERKRFDPTRYQDLCEKALAEL